MLALKRQASEFRELGIQVLDEAVDWIKNLLI